MIICNGSPKTGTHLLLKAVRLFGGECLLAVHRHNPKVNTVEHKNIHIIRNPRNALLSYLRMSSIEPLRANIIKEMPRFIDEYSQYLHYLNDKKTLTVQFELLLSSPDELDKIAGFLGKKKITRHFEKLDGETATYTGKGMRSDWREIWTHDKIARKWEEFGGVELENKLGYTND